MIRLTGPNTTLDWSVPGRGADDVCPPEVHLTRITGLPAGPGTAADRSVRLVTRMTTPHDHRIARDTVRAVHTGIFAAELAAILWLVVSGLIGRRDRTVGLAAAAVAVEIGVFLANDRVCPLTPLAERLGAAHGSVSDIFLPDAVARTIPIWSTALLVFAALAHARAWINP